MVGYDGLCSMLPGTLNTESKPRRAWSSEFECRTCRTPNAHSAGSVQATSHHAPVKMTRLQSSDGSQTTEYPSVPRVRVFKNLSGDDFRHSIDQQTTAMLRGLPGLEMVARTVLGGPGVEHALYLENISAALLVGPNQLPTLHKLLQEACACLNMTPPALYVRQVRGAASVATPACTCCDA